jgi:hypothetical protein
MASRLILSVAKRLVIPSGVEESLIVSQGARVQLTARDVSTSLDMTGERALEYEQQPPDEAWNAVEVFKKK